jgi:hypothetical protein
MSSSTFPLRPLTFALPALLVLAGTQIGCQSLMFWRSKPQPMHSAADVPASQGTVRLKKSANGNSELTIRVKHLAPPSRIAADATVYVVWIQALDGARQNVGALVLDSDLEGKLETVTPFQRFQILVTPEPSGQAAAPTHEPVFTYNVESAR